MPNLEVTKELNSPGTPLFLFECKAGESAARYWSTHRVTCEGVQYQARVLSHSPIEYRAGGGDESPFLPKISVRLANADQALSPLTVNQAWKGADIKVKFAVVDLETGQVVSGPIMMLRGTANAPDESDYKSIKLSIINRLGAMRAYLPVRRVQKRCSWLFPRTVEERTLAAESAGAARYSPFFGCGYSADVLVGVGNLETNGVFTTCGYTKNECIARGMFDTDSASRATRRFSGFQFVPASRLVRGYGDARPELTISQGADVSGGVVVPIVFGTNWADGIVTIAQSDGNLMRMEVVVCEGPVAGVVKVVAEGVEVPLGVDGRDMTATGWYNVVSVGARTGAFNMDFSTAAGVSEGDPNGGTAVLSVVIPTSLIKGSGLPEVQVLVQGLKLPMYDSAGAPVGEGYTSNPAWVLLDVLQRAGYRADDIDLPSFATAAATCGEVLQSLDSQGNPVLSPRSDCNGLLRTKRSVGDVIRGIQLGAGLSVRFESDGKLHAFVESRLAVQQAALPTGSNAVEALSGGWPSYEFGDGTDGRGGIALSRSGEPTLRLYSRSHSETANRVSVEYIDPLDDYVVDTYSLVDIDDVVRAGQEIHTRLEAMGVTGQAQAYRLCRRVLERNLRGNLFAEFESSIKALMVKPGEIITLHVPGSGLLRRPFRVLSVAPGFNGERVKIVAQVHEDAWYEDTTGETYASGSGCEPCLAAEVRPLLGDQAGPNGESIHTVVEETVERADGSQQVRLGVGFRSPSVDVAPGEQRPLVSSVATVAAGGSMVGAQVVYYGLTETDAQGRESKLSATVQAIIPSGATGAAVTISGIRVSPGVTGLSVYRGPDPWQLRRIASEVAVATTFVDPGLSTVPIGPPDPHFARAVAEWRTEYLPPVNVSTSTESAVVVSGVTLTPGTLKGRILRVHSGTGAGQERVISDNSESEVWLASKWRTKPDSTSSVCVVENGWANGGSSLASPCWIEVPNHSGTVVQLRVYGVNGAGVQSRKDLAEVTRYTIGGALGSGWDAAVPPKPTFGVATREGGYLELGGIGFSDLANTGSITAGVLNVHYLSELTAAPIATLSEAVLDSTASIGLSIPVSIPAGTMMLLGSELLRCVTAAVNQTQCAVERGVYGSTSAAHGAGDSVYILDRRVVTIPIPRQFFGSTASGDFSYSIPLASSKVLAADLMFTNSKGNSEAGAISLTGLPDGGLRVLQGGQITIQVGGYLAVQTSAAPPIVVEQSRSIRDVFAIVDEAPVGAPVIMRVRRNGAVLCELTVSAGATMSNTVAGASLGPLVSMERITLDVVSVGAGPTTSPGRNLTVTIRL